MKNEMEINMSMVPGVTLICLDCTEEEINEIMSIEYENLEIKFLKWKTEGLHGVFQIILDTKNPYICFCETGMLSAYNKIQKMVAFLEQTKNAGCVLCQQEYILEDGTHIGYMNQGFMKKLEEYGSVLNGNGILELSLNLEENLYGSLSCCMIRKESFIHKSYLLNYLECSKEEERMLLMFECLYGMKVGRINDNLVKAVEKKIDIEGSIREENYFKKLRGKILSKVYKRSSGKSLNLPGCYNKEDRRSSIGKIEKHITLFYGSKAEQYIVEPLGNEAEKRGYHVSYSDDLSKEAEIGVYCSHVGCLQQAGYHSKFSVIMFHDMRQGVLNWPDIWNMEPWNDFDIGILPGQTWVERWQLCSGFRYVHPKLGVFEGGYPKGDYLYGNESRIKTEKLKKSLNMMYDKTVLYAPSWENDGKEDDFVKSLCDLKVNLLIKQAISKGYPEKKNNIIQMRKMHEGKYNNVYYMNTEDNIMDAYSFCDIVVSDESGTLTEALLFDKASISVTDWLVPTVTPPRFTFVPVDYVRKCKKAELRETVERTLNEKGNILKNKKNQVYSHLGESSSVILDLVDYYTGQSDDRTCLKTEVQPSFRLHGLWS